MSAALILAIDSASRQLKLALQYGVDRTVKSDETMEYSHGQVLVRKIDALMQSAGAAKKDLTGIIVNNGPGSFTGIRIGIAMARGIQAALELPLVPVSMFDIAAYRLREIKETFAVLAPIKRDACVLSYVKAGKWIEDKLQVIDFGAGDSCDMLDKSKIAAIGYDSAEASNILPEPVRFLVYDGSDLLAVGLPKLQGAISKAGDDIEPLYAQASQAEINLSRRGKID